MHPRPARHRKRPTASRRRRARQAARPRQRRKLWARHRAVGGKGDRPPGARAPALQAAGLRAGVAHAPRPLPASTGVAPLSAAVRDPRPRRPPPSGLPARRRGGRDAGAVLRHPGHELAAPADPRRLALDASGWRAAAISVYYDGAHIRLVAWQTPRGVYWVSNTPQPRPLQPRDARHRPLAHAHPRRLRHRSQLISTSTRPGKRSSRSSRRSEISRCVPSARVRVTPASRSRRRW